MTGERPGRSLPRGVRRSTRFPGVSTPLSLVHLRWKGYSRLRLLAARGRPLPRRHIRLRLPGLGRYILPAEDGEIGVAGPLRPLLPPDRDQRHLLPDPRAA